MPRGKRSADGAFCEAYLLVVLVASLKMSADITPGHFEETTMPRKLIDISFANDVPADPPGNHPTIRYIDHQQGACCSSSTGGGSA